MPKKKISEENTICANQENVFITSGLDDINEKVKKNENAIKKCSKSIDVLEFENQGTQLELSSHNDELYSIREKIFNIRKQLKICSVLLLVELIAIIILFIKVFHG